MGVNRGDIPKLITSGLRTEFMGDKGFGLTQSDLYKTLCIEVPSTKASETYAWLGQLPKMREWLSERTIMGLSEHGFSIINKDFESTIRVDRNALEDEQYGQFKVLSQLMGQEARRFYDEYLISVIEANGLAYDGQNFFDTDHSSGTSGTQSNAPAASSTYTVTTAAQMVAVLNLVTSAMAQFKGDAGKHFGARVTHVLVPTSLEWVAREAFDPTYRGTGTATAADMGKGRVQILVSEFLTNNATPGYSPIYWLDLSKPVKPFIFQNRKNPEFVALDKTDSYENFMSKGILYGVDNRFNMGLALWQFAYKTTGSV